jgi:thioredoxin reductase
MISRLDELPVAVVGAGPIGLAAAAHLAERGLDFLVLESGDTVGATVAAWGNVRMFSPWRYNTDAAARRMLATVGWAQPDPDALPTGRELVDAYLVPLAGHPAIAARLRLRTRVEAVTRVGHDRVRTAGRETAPFLLRTRTPDGDVGEVEARAVVDASGTWGAPNVLGGDGLPALGEVENADRITPALPDVLGAQRHRFAGRHTVVVGAGHSAATTLLELVTLAETEPGTTVTWAIRSGAATRAYGGGEADALPARGAIGIRLQSQVQAGRIGLVTGFHIRTIIAMANGGLELTGRAADGTEQKVTADVVVNATGFRPDHSIGAELRLDLDPILGSTRVLAPLIDPNHHSCGTVPPHGVDELAHPEPGYYAVGAKSYGRAPTFLLATGYEQARSVVAALAGDWAAARRVELDLPETGVCSSSSSTTTTTTATTATATATTVDGEACCATPAESTPAQPAPVATGIQDTAAGPVTLLPVIERPSSTCC